VRRPDVPEDLALAVSRCLEKDPENRWPSADALRRSLESRTVSGYRPTGTSFKGQRFDAPGEARPLTGSRARPVPGTASRRGLEPRSGLGPRPLPAPRDPRDLRRREYRERRPEKDQAPDTGEPRIVQKVRGQFASWAAVSLGCLGINIATGITDPWFLFPMFGMGIGVFRNYAQLWQSGYSWRDVLTRPPAPDAIETTLVKGTPRMARQLPPPRADEFGAHIDAIRQVQSDRQAILKLLDRLPPSERKLLPEVQQTVNGLYERATDVARTLHAMDSNMDTEGLTQIDERIAALAKEPDDPERARRLNLLERQKQTILDLRGRRGQVASHLESCVLAMQNVRFDLLRLRSAGVAAVLGDLTQATQQAKALSRDVDNAIAAAGEIREAMRP
jgi:hypothetical protein